MFTVILLSIFRVNRKKLTQIQFIFLILGWLIPAIIVLPISGTIFSATIYGCQPGNNELIIFLCIRIAISFVTFFSVCLVSIKYIINSNGNLLKKIKEYYFTFLLLLEL
eukprot:TRINITY_DN3109_c0_g1_i1.p1 TRINITY_DN3109_c0_g1~~TRINITY_DN3109_c0_g1_i1.p1  ORF type:complete len:109 (-),score=6.11 TRINITY_DN3109_c0_g1_i1:281-607(-)